MIFKTYNFFILITVPFGSTIVFTILTSSYKMDILLSIGMTELVQFVWIKLLYFLFRSALQDPNDSELREAATTKKEGSAL